MKSLIYVLVMLCISGSNMLAQSVFHSTNTTLTSGEISYYDAKFGSGNYSAYSFDVDALINQAAMEVAQLDFTVNIGGDSYDVTVNRNEILPGNFTAEVVEGANVTDMTGDVIMASYRGNIQNDPSTKVNLAVTNLGIKLNFLFASGERELAPSFYQNENVFEEDEYLWYSTEETHVPSFCPDLSGGYTEPLPCFETGTGVDFEGTEMRGNCRRSIEIALEGDVPFTTGFPDTFTGNLRAMLSMFFTVEAAEPVYINEFGMGFQISSVRIFRDQATSPYTAPMSLLINSNITRILNEIRDEFSTITQQEIRRDVVILFSGNTCTSPIGTLRGAARLGATCLIESPVLITTCIFTQIAPHRTVAHEIGHTLGADHPENNTCGGVCALGLGLNSLMCQGNCDEGDPLFLDTESKKAIRTHLKDFGGCLQQDAMITGPEFLCPGQTATYTFVPNSTLNPNLAWVLSPGLTLVSQTATTVTVTANLNHTGRVFVQANVNDFGFMDGCDPKFRRNIVVGALPAVCEGPNNYQLCMGTFSGLQLLTRAGWNISNIQCQQPGNNCSNLNLVILGQGSSFDIFANSGTPGLYEFSYDITTTCGTYTFGFFVEVVSGNDCHNSPKTITAGAGNLEELALQVVPNPNNGNFTLQYTLPMETTPEIRVLNAQGQEVLELPSSGWKNSGEYAVELNLGHLPSGMYLVNLRTDTGQKTVRMSVNR